MKYKWIFFLSLWIENARAEIITVTNVKVSVTANTATAAREKALDQAYDIAFQKLLHENFQEPFDSLPPHNAIVDMVTDFSIDREKTTSTNYTASLTFQFDGPHLQAWFQQKNSNKEGFSLAQPFTTKKPLKIRVSYTSLSEWQNVKKTLENFFGAQNMIVLAISLQNANMEVTYGGKIEKLQQDLLKKGYLLSPYEDGWIIASNKPLSP